MKSIFELNKNDIVQYINDKKINDCPACQKKNTIEPVYDDDLKIICKSSELLKFSDSEEGFKVMVNSYDVLIVCSHCGIYNTIAPGKVLRHFTLST